MDYYPKLSAHETKQTNKQNNLPLTVSCQKSCLIRRKKMNQGIKNNNNKSKEKREKKKRLKI